MEQRAGTARQDPNGWCAIVWGVFTQQFSNQSGCSVWCGLEEEEAVGRETSSCDSFGMGKQG